MFKSGLDTLCGGDQDELLDFPVVREKSFGDMLLGPFRHIDGYPLVSGFVALDQPVPGEAAFFTKDHETLVRRGLNPLPQSFLKASLTESLMPPIVF